MFIFSLPFLLVFLTFAQSRVVTKIVDGDTVHVLVNNQKIEVHCIDTPESKMIGMQKVEIINGVNIGEL